MILFLAKFWGVTVTELLQLQSANSGDILTGISVMRNMPLCNAKVVKDNGGKPLNKKNVFNMVLCFVCVSHVGPGSEIEVLSCRVLQACRASAAGRSVLGISSTA